MSKEVMFNGRPEDVVWRSEVTHLKKGNRVYSRKDSDVVVLNRGGLIGIYNDSNRYNEIPVEKHSFFARLFKVPSPNEHYQIYYINKVAHLENKWGTPDRINVYEKDLDVHTSIGANGSYQFSINDTNLLLSKVQGAYENLTQEMVKQFFHTALIMEIRNSLANIFSGERYSLKDIPKFVGKEKEIAAIMKESLAPHFNKYGVTLEHFYLMKIDFDQAFINNLAELQKAAALRRVARQDFKEDRELAKEDLKDVTDTIVKLKEAEKEPTINIYASNKKHCKNCGKELAVNSKFCQNCGTKQ